MSNRIKEIFDSRGIKPAVFARQINIPQSTMSTIYHGRTMFENIRVEHFIAIAHGLGMTADELFGGSNPEGYTSEEIALVEMYRETDDRGRRTIDAIARTESGR